MRRSTACLLKDFEDRVGYAPDVNVVTKSGAGEVGLDGERLGDSAVLPVAVVESFEVIEEVSLPDVWNGYFLGPASRVTGGTADGAARWLVVRGRRVEIVVIGSDRGGALYAVLVEDGSVVRVEEAAICDGPLVRAREGQVRLFAPSFAEFLGLFACELESFADGDSTPSFWLNAAWSEERPPRGS